MILVSKDRDVEDESGQIVAELWTTESGGLFGVHSARSCVDYHNCCLHSPSDHHMRDWPLNIRNDRIDDLAERICTHGVGHPDPDSLAYIMREDSTNTWSGIHGCDGCCAA